MLADWTADLNVSFGIDPAAESPQERNIQMMELMRYEKYDYVMIVCRNEIDYLQLTRALGIDDAKVLVAKKRKIRARAVWYDDMEGPDCQEAGGRQEELRPVMEGVRT